MQNSIGNAFRNKSNLLLLLVGVLCDILRVILGAVFKESFLDQSSRNDLHAGSVLDGVGLREWLLATPDDHEGDEFVGHLVHHLLGIGALLAPGGSEVLFCSQARLAFFNEKRCKRFVSSAVLEEGFRVNIADELLDDFLDNCDGDDVAQSLSLCLIGWVRVLRDVAVDHCAEPVQRFNGSFASCAFVPVVLVFLVELGVVSVLLVIIESLIVVESLLWLIVIKSIIVETVIIESVLLLLLVVIKSLLLLVVVKSRLLLLLVVVKPRLLLLLVVIETFWLLIIIESLLWLLVVVKAL